MRAKFPLKSLPITLREAVLAIHDIVQAPKAMIAQSVLAATNYVAQGLYDITSLDGSHRPCSMFFVTLGLSGERKSASDEKALAAILAYQDKLVELNQIQKQEYKRLCREAKQNGDSEPREPKRPLILLSEPSLEGLVMNLEYGHAAQGLFSSEGLAFLNGWAMQSERALNTATGLCKLWDSGRFDRCRKDSSFLIYGKRLCMHLLMQPDGGMAFLSDPKFTDQGLNSRLLALYPDSEMGKRPYRKAESISHLNLESFTQKILNF